MPYTTKNKTLQVGTTSTALLAAFLYSRDFPVSDLRLGLSAGWMGAAAATRTFKLLLRLMLLLYTLYTYLSAEEQSRAIPTLASQRQERSGSEATAAFLIPAPDITLPLRAPNPPAPSAPTRLLLTISLPAMLLTIITATEANNGGGGGE